MSEEIQKVQLSAQPQEIAKPLVMTIKDAERTFAVLPPEHTLHDVSQYMPPPARPRQRVTLLSVDAFVEYVNRFRLISTTVFANEQKATYEAVLDYHTGEELNVADKRGNQDHIANYNCPLSDEWKIWSGSDTKWFGQEEFATFIEHNLRDISEPSGATLMQVALELQVHKGAQFASEMRLENGQRRFRYEETIRGSTRAGDLDVPSAFKISIPVFIDGNDWEIDARFRYRMVEGALTLGYELIRPLEIWREAVKEVSSSIARTLTDCAFYAGMRGS